MSVQTLNELAEADRRSRMAKRCDELAAALEENEWVDEVRGRMFETAAMLSCYAYELRSRTSPDAELAAYKQAVEERFFGTRDVIKRRVAEILAANA